MKKIIELLKSRRFWLLTVGAASAIGASWVAGDLTLVVVLDTVKLWAIGVAGVGTLDKLVTK